MAPRLPRGEQGSAPSPVKCSTVPLFCPSTGIRLARGLSAFRKVGPGAGTGVRALVGHSGARVGGSPTVTLLSQFGPWQLNGFRKGIVAPRCPTFRLGVSPWDH